MATETNQFAHLTERCQNFKSYLENNFKVMDFGEFACAYTFSFEEVRSMMEAATNSYSKPTLFRVYYGCDGQGGDHQLFFAILDAEENVILVQTINAAPTTNTSQSAINFLGDLAAQPLKCPPGGSKDLIIRSLL